MAAAETQLTQRHASPLDWPAAVDVPPREDHVSPRARAKAQQQQPRCLTLSEPLARPIAGSADAASVVSSRSAHLHIQEGDLLEAGAGTQASALLTLPGLSKTT